MVFLSSTWLILALYTLTTSAASVATIPQSAWTQLNSTVGGRLVRGIPYARPCFARVGPGVSGSKNGAACAVVQADYVNNLDLTAQFGTYINTQWETCQSTNEKCLLDYKNSTNPVPMEGVCSQGSIPDYGINVVNPSDVTAGFQFSKKWGIPVVVKNTGHDYKGHSGGPGTLAIWVGNIKGITHNPVFIPTGCPKSTTPKNGVTFGAGVVYNDLVNFADANKLTIPAGGDVSVGPAGGYPQGGGHGMLSNVFGLAADRVLEMEVVTPRGDHLIANECQNTDLFWAMRGGGGGTFGVVLKLTSLAFPATQVNAVFGTVDPTVPGNLLKFFQFMTDNALDYAKQGWGYYLYPSLPGIALANTILSPAEAKASMAPLMNLLMHNMTGSTWEMTLEPNYKTYYPKYVTRVPVPNGFAMTTASRLIPVSVFESASQRAQLAQAMTSIKDEAPVAIAFGVAPFYHGNNHDTSVSPAWYDSLWHLAVADTWNYDADTKDLTEIYSNLSTAIDPFRKLAPNSGAYLNEADVYEPDWQQSFWGENYPRLLSIKNKYDPDHLLDCWQCVGWLGPKDDRYKCYIHIEGY
ncbi:FAD-binding domain-containing protein [Roridomyces roridus]|uniref:FAD-binding domain-containing protein n=1 Tax=Roridomyces roridus TaxID=1738132 RepID=A0AAD7FSU5_9AGAR|nr:FAD-binding domain-containing protein [Roridomyces roridus]